MIQNKYAICKKCHDVIVMRRPGSSVWKRTDSNLYRDKIMHTPINGITFDSHWDADKIKKKAREIYWANWTDEERPEHYKAWELSVDMAVSAMGYVDAK